MKSKYKALIVEDDSIVVEQLVVFLEQTSLFETPYICNSTMEAVLALRDTAVDLVMLDMELPDMPGLELLRLFPNHPPVIAISAHPLYAVDCYDCEVNDFITKPLSYSRFLRGLRRTVLQTSAEPSTLAITSHGLPTAPILPTNLFTTNSPYIYLKVGRKVERFLLSEILYVEACSIYSKLISSTGTSGIHEQLSRVEKQLNLNNFVRVHKSYLINVNQITQFSSNVIWIGAHKIPIGGTYKTKVQERLKSLSLQVY